jgi:hypothetical protein
MPSASGFARNAVRAIGATAGAAGVGTAIALLPLLITLELSHFILALVLLYPVYLAILGLLGWPCIAILRSFGFRHATSFVVAGAVLGALVSLIVSVGFAEQRVAQALWMICGSASGAVAFAIMQTFRTRMIHVQQLEDQLSGFNTPQIAYRAFFSYSRADDGLADWLWGYLDRYRVPPGLVVTGLPLGAPAENLHPIFRDRFDLSAGGNLSMRLQSALERSDSLIVLCTPESSRSAWVEHEVQTFLRTGKEARIFPVIAAGEPDSADPSTECFPPSLRGRGILAADLREAGTGPIPAAASAMAGSSAP